jgi:hypothetical protein
MPTAFLGFNGFAVSMPAAFNFVEGYAVQCLRRLMGYARFNG